MVSVNSRVSNGIRFKLELRGTRKPVGPHPRSQPLCCHLFFIDRKSLRPLIAPTWSFQFSTMATDSQPIRFSLSLPISIFHFFFSSLFFKKIIPRWRVFTFFYLIFFPVCVEKSISLVSFLSLIRVLTFLGRRQQKDKF